MNNRSLAVAKVRVGQALAVAVLGVLLGSCGEMGVKDFVDHPPVTIVVLPKNSPCPPAYTCASRNNYLIGVSEEPIDLTTVSSTDNKLTWVIPNSPGWKFVTNKGIEFRKSHWRVDDKYDTQYSAHATKDGVIYKYSISVTNGSDPPVTWDPSIMN
jgi:hypothetical protein